MVTEISSKSELAALATQLSNQAMELASSVESLISAVSSAPDYDGINVTGAANIIRTNLETILTDLEIISTNIVTYSNELNKFDSNDMDFDEVIEEATLDEEIEKANIQTTSSTSQSQSSNSNNLTSAGLSAVTAGVTANNGLSNSSNSSTSTSTSSSNVKDSTVTAPTTITPSGKTSSNGRTQRSAVTEIAIKPGDPNIDISRYKNNEANGFKVTTGNLSYDLCDEDFELLCAIVSAESDKSYDDALAVVTTILNRCETSNWIASHGKDPISQATAPNQFVVYQHGSYSRYMNGNAPETVVQAVKDALAGVRNHNYCSFRSNGSTGYSSNMISPTGNRYK